MAGQLRCDLIIALSLTMIASSALGAEARVQPLGGGRFRVTADALPVTTTDAAQRLLQPVFEQVCAPRSFVLEKFEYTSTARVGRPADAVAESPRLDLVQDVACTDAPAVSVATPSFGDRDARADEATVRAASLRYLESIDAENAEAAFEHWSDSMAATITRSSWIAEQNALAKSAGKLLEQSLYQVTRYENPQNGPPGLFIAVDFSSRYEHLPFRCGYLVWSLADTAFRLIRVESNSLDDETAKRMTEAQIIAFRQQMRCQ